jgi:hypothetical protein
MDNTQTLITYSTRLRGLEITLSRALTEIRRLAEEIDYTIKELEKKKPPVEKPSLGLYRPDSPLVFTPLSPAPRPKSVRRVQSLIPISVEHSTGEILLTPYFLHTDVSLRSTPCLNNVSWARRTVKWPGLSPEHLIKISSVIAALLRTITYLCPGLIVFSLMFFPACTHSTPYCT